ncbi:hypothetical protein [Mucilaginibacter sp. HD30]
MIAFIDSEHEYVQATISLSKILNKEIDMVDNPFNKEFTIYKAFEFDRIYGSRFFDGLSKFLMKINSAGFTFYTVIPNPAEYFFSCFLKYSIGKIPITSSFNDYWDFLNANPGNPADALMDNSETIAMYSNEPMWGIIGSKDLEIGIVGFRNNAASDEFLKCFEDYMFVDIKSRLEELDNMLSLQPDTKLVYEQILKNYT